MEEDKLSQPPTLSPDEREPLPVVKSLDLTGANLMPSEHRNRGGKNV